MLSMLCDMNFNFEIKDIFSVEPIDYNPSIDACKKYQFLKDDLQNTVNKLEIFCIEVEPESILCNCLRSDIKILKEQIKDLNDLTIIS